jgi:hypothetical protein
MMRIRTAAVWVALAGALAWPVADATAQTASTSLRTAKPEQPVVTDASAQRRRPSTRLRVTPNYRPDDVYPRYFPGRNAVRDCTATYAQEYRPSGTVIVPHMNCYWRRG